MTIPPLVRAGMNQSPYQTKPTVTAQNAQQPLPASIRPPTMAPTIAPPAAAAPQPAAKPSTPPSLTPEQRVAADTAAGKAAADASGIGAEGSMGRLTDARAQEINDLLARQKAGLGGMTPEEMQAAREQGTSTINRQLATNLQQLGDIAAGNGIRGGSAAGLQMQALSGAQDASGQLARQMILDNVAQKNIAMDRYGNTLQGQQSVGLGIQGANNDSMNAETLARQLYGDNYASRIDATRSGDKADSYTQQGIDLTKEQINALKADKQAQGSAEQTRGLVGPGVGKAPASAETISKAPAMWDYGGKHYVRADTLTAGKDSNFTDTYIDANGVRYVDPGTATNAEAAKGAADTAHGPTVICTEAHRQKLISDSEYRITQAYGAWGLTAKQHAAYLIWATPAANAMKRHPLLAKIIGRLVKYEVRAMRAKLLSKPAPLLGQMVLHVFEALNFAFGLCEQTNSTICEKQ